MYQYPILQIQRLRKKEQVLLQKNNVIMNYYERFSQPLKRLSEDQISAGSFVYNELGTCVQKIIRNDEVYFIDVIESVLKDGEVMSELTPNQLVLFWALSRSKLQKQGIERDETKSTNKRKRILY